MPKFERKYLTEDERNALRDRFQVELGQGHPTRQELKIMQVALRQSKDATALKQWAWLGWLAYSNIPGFMVELRDTLLKNEANNRRVGLSVEGELESKFPAVWEGNRNV